MRLLAILCAVFLYIFSVDTALAQQELQPAEPTKVYSADNPFAGSQYTDLADLTELLLRQGYNVDQYFYSEGFSTGMDGTLGNEYVCFRDDANQVYIGRSDICRDREMDSTYSYIQIDKMDWSNGFPDLTILQTGDLIGNTYEYWDGCFNITTGPQWGGYSGGQCPNLSLSYDGQINYGYIPQVLTNLAAINLALEEAGIEATGYNYSWSIKNWDANYKDQGNGRSQADPFQVTVRITDQDNNVVFSKTYDYSYHISDWTTFAGEEIFNEPIDGSTLQEIQLSIYGYDLGYWAGYYGPEFRNPSIKLNYRAVAQEDTLVEDILFDQMCMQDPTYDMNCPGYNDAIISQIASSSSIEDLNNTPDLQTPTPETGIEEPQLTAAVESSTASMEETIEQEIAEVVAAEVKEVTNDAVEEAASEPASAEERKSTGLSANQLLALNIAENATSAAQSTAAAAAQQSASIGLSESGGVSSELTADGVSNADGTLSTDIFSSTGSSESSDQNTVELANSNMSDSTESDSLLIDQLLDGETSNDSSTVITDNSLDNTIIEVSSAESVDLNVDSSTIEQTSNELALEFSSNESFESTSDSSLESNSFSSDVSLDVQEVSNSIEIFELDTQQSLNQENTNFEMTTEVTEDFEIDTTTNNNNDEFELASLDLSELENLSVNNTIINDIVNAVTNNIILEANKVAEEIAEESSEESVEEQNAREDELVSQALSGSNDEDAQAALLGYNPNFRAYQQPQMTDGQFYQPKDIYEGQTNYDNPSARFFNGASDSLHRQMVRQQYERN